MSAVSLEDMRLLVAVVQAGSLSQASDLLGVPVSRLSRRLTILEAELGTKIVNRGKKGVSLNAVGERFFVHAQNMLAHASLALSSLHDELQRPAGLLRVSVAVDVAYYVLAPRLPEYLARFPDVRLEVSLNQNKINMIQDGIDVAIRAGAVGSENAVAKVLYPIKMSVVASREYLALHGVPSAPNELYEHKLIVQKLLPNWEFVKGKQRVKITPNAYVSCNDFLFVQKMVSQGLGIGVVPESVADVYPEWLRLFEDWQFENRGVLSVVYYKNRGAVPIVQSFVAWLVEVFQRGLG